MHNIKNPLWKSYFKLHRTNTKEFRKVRVRVIMLSRQQTICELLAIKAGSQNPNYLPF
jgi:hypothetical protein